MKEFKFLKSKIGKKLNALLSSHPTFKSNWKSIEPARFFLSKVADKMYSTNESKVEISSKYIEAIFRPYTKGEYVRYLQALEQLSLLDIDHSYTTMELAEKRSNESGKTVEPECKKYSVSQEAINLLSNMDKEALNMLHNDKKTIRKVQQNKSARKNHQKTYADYLINYMHDLQINLSYNKDTVESIIEFESDDLRRRSMVRTVAKLNTGVFNDPFYGSKDDRLINDYTNMCTDIRSTLSYKNLVRIAVVDIRACHPTFFSSYVYYKLFIPPSPILLRYVTHKHDIISEYDNICENEVKVEHLKWIKMWCNPDMDIRTQIAEELNTDKDTIKQYFNETLNGHKVHKPILRWIEGNFPVLYKIWMKTDVKTTGPEISKHFEQVLMRNQGLYEYATDMGLKLGYENDGFTVFADKENNDVKTQVEFITNYLKYVAKDKWGFSPIIKTEFV